MHIVGKLNMDAWIKLTPKSRYNGLQNSHMFIELNSNEKEKKRTVQKIDPLSFFFFGCVCCYRQSRLVRVPVFAFPNAIKSDENINIASGD